MVEGSANSRVRVDVDTSLSPALDHTLIRFLVWDGNIGLAAGLQESEKQPMGNGKDHLRPRL